MGHCFGKVLKPTDITKSPTFYEGSRGQKGGFSFSCASSHLRPFAIRTPTVERQEKAATGNQNPCGIRAIQ